MSRAQYVGAVAWAALLAGGGSGSAWALQGPSPGAVSPQKLKLPDGPASIRGLSDAATVNIFSAQVGYTIPIDLPGGFAGFGPGLSLSYSGDVGNGPMGIGWRIGGIAVRRSLRHGVPTYTDADELELEGIGDGGRLVPNGTNVWSVEGKGNLIRVERHGAHLEVLDGTGTRYFLGTSEEGTEGVSGRTLAWHAQWIRNVANQMVEIHYIQDQGQIYLSKILWGPANKLHVDLAYRDRPDVAVSWRSGYEVRTAKLLESIKVYSFETGADDFLRSYAFSYASPARLDDFRLSRLSGITMSGRGGQGALPPLKFEYGKPRAPEAVKVEGLDGWFLNDRGTTLLDVDGDGMADLARLEMGNHLYRKNVGGRFAASRSITGAAGLELETSSLMDLDGDARPELVRVVDDTWRYSRLVGETWVGKGEWANTTALPLQSTSSALADLNGDGRTDVIRGTATSLQVNFNSRDGMGPTRVLPRISNVAELEPGNRNVRFVDMNGDGLADVVWLTDLWMKVYLGRGDGTFVPFKYANYPWEDPAKGLHPVVNLDDIVLADLDRDGLVDLIRFTAGHVVWYQGTTECTFSTEGRSLSRPDDVSYDAVVTVADVNGNGSQDVIWSSPRGMWLLDLAGPTSAGMLVSVDNGMGKTTTFEYSSSAILSVADENAGHVWSLKLPVSIAVPVSATMIPSPGEAPRQMRFAPRDGFWDGDERRFGGFLAAVETSVGSTPFGTLVAEQRFLPGLGAERVLRGKLWFRRVADGAGVVFTQVRSDWLALPSCGVSDASVLTRRAALKREHTWVYEGQPTAVETEKSYTFDGCARPVVEYQSGRLDIPEDQKDDRRVVHTRYADDDEKYGVRDRVCEQWTTRSDGASGDADIVSKVMTIYGDEKSTPAAECKASKGWPRERRVYLAANTFGDTPGYKVESQTSYDSYGNIVHTYEGWVNRDIIYDDLKLHPIEERLTDAAQPLSWSASWDYVLGQMTSVIDPNGRQTHLDYDSLGRLISMSVDARDPHVRYEYDWSVPGNAAASWRPSTTTWQFDGKLDDVSSGGWPGDVRWRKTVAVANGAGETLYSATFAPTQGAGSRWIVGSWTERDERGRVRLRAEPFYSTTDRPTQRETLARVETYAYDATGRLVEQTLPNGARKAFTFNAPFEQTVMATGLAPVHSVRDGFGRIMLTERQVETGLEYVRATYDAADRIVQLELQNHEATHSFKYDTLGRLREASDDDTGPRQLFYEAARFTLLSEHVNAAVGPSGDSQHVYFEYDPLGRLIRRGETADTGSADYRFIYDASDKAGAGCRTLGKLAEVQEPTGDVVFCYDEMGRQRGYLRSITPDGSDAESGGEELEYSASNLVLKQTADDGFALQYRYDRAARPVAVHQDGVGDLWVVDDMDAAGRVVQEHFANGTRGTHQFDRLGLQKDVEVFSEKENRDLFHILVRRTPYGAPQLITDLLHTTVPDPDGRPTENRMDGSRDHNASFSYDSAARMVDASLGRGADQIAAAYRYDRLQNMVLRQICGPSDLNLGLLQGEYRYGEVGADGKKHGPRQLTSVRAEMAQ